MGLFIKAERIIADNKGFSFSLLCLSSLVVAFFNIRLNSYFLGSLSIVTFFIPMTIFIGRIIFKEEYVVLRMIFGFITLLALIACFGTLIYFIIDYSWFSMFALLITLTFSLSFINRRSNFNLSKPINNESNNESKIMDLMDYRKDTAFIILILFSIYAVYIGRTGESIKTFWETINPMMFFIPFFLSSFIAVFMILSNKISVIKGLSYVILLTLVVSIIPIVVLKYPQTNMMGRNIALSRQLYKFGRFVNDYNQIERASSPFHKQIEFIGYYIIMVTLSRLLGSDPINFNVLLTPLLFAFYVPIFSYITIRIVFPKKHKMALISALSLLISQHNIHLLIPPGKPETLGLLFLLISIMFWSKLLCNKSKISLPSILIPILFSIVTCLLHPHVGLYSISLTIISLYLYIVEHFDPKKNHLNHNLLYKIIYIILIIFFSLFLILAYQFYNIFQTQYKFMLTLNYDFIEWLKVLLPPFETLYTFSLEGLHNLYLNNFNYILYALLFTGFILSYRWHINRNFLFMIFPLVLMSFTSMILQQFFYPKFWSREYYRFFYYLNFISYPIVGISLYFIIRGFSAKLVRKITINIKFRKYRGSVPKIRKYSTWKSLKIPVLTTLFTILLSSMVSSSVYGGFPRVGSLGPYSGVYPTFVSEHDIAAMKYISERESKSDRAFFIIGDSDTAAAALLEFGEKNYLIEGKYRSFVSYRTAEGMNIWSEIISSPSQIVLDDALKAFGADIVYLVLTYRIGESLSNIVSYYDGLLLFPVFKIAEKIYVFEYPI